MNTTAQFDEATKSAENEVTEKVETKEECKQAGKDVNKLQVGEQNIQDKGGTSVKKPTKRGRKPKANPAESTAKEKPVKTGPNAKTFPCDYCSEVC